MKLSEVFLIIMCILLQWNARSLLSNGLEFKKVVNELVPDIICVQETFLHGKYSFTLAGYHIFRRDREDEIRGGGVAILLKNGIIYSEVTVYKQVEAISVNVSMGGDEIKVINVYVPPGSSIPEDVFSTFLKDGNLLLCGDFNAKHPLWGSSESNRWGSDLVEMLEENNLVVLNSGEGTRIDIASGNKSPLDLTITSSNLAGFSEWEVLDELCGSDHFMIKTSLNESIKSESMFVPRWNFKKADWKSFELYCDLEFSMVSINEDIEGMVKGINDIIIQAADKFIPKTKQKSKNPVPYWNDECSEAIRERKHIRRRLERTKNPRDYIEFKKRRAKVIRTLKDARTKYWESFCSKLSYRSDVGKVWRTVRGINNVGKHRSIPSIKIDGKSIFDTKEKCNAFAQQFAFVSSSENYSEEFKKRKEKFEKENASMFQPQSNDDMPVNEDIQFQELVEALEECKKVSAPGPDDINYIMLKNLSENSLRYILSVFNVMWCKGVVPDVWKQAVVVPILKEGKDESLPVSYRPISLTSNLCKVFEKIVSKRLVSYLEKHHLFNINQSGFRKNRRTLDHLIRISEDIRKSLATKGYTVGVFLDIEKAYDMVWRKGVLYKLNKMGIGGNMFNWVNSFLHSRKIKVRLGSVLSDEYELDNGTPQGSVISPLLFLIAINDLEVEDGINLSLFADDSAVWKSGRNLKFLEKKLQETLDKIKVWCNEWGFKVSIEKTQVIVFTRKRKNKVELKYNDCFLKVVKKVRFLGLIFDTKLSWKDHIQLICDKCVNRVNLLRCIAGSKWGANKENLVYVYKALVRSRIDYGCEVYGTAPRSLLHKLDVIQNKCLRVCSGALKVTPIEAMEVDCGVMPLDLRRNKLKTRIVATYLESTNNPVKQSLEESWHAYYSKSKEGFKSILSSVSDFLPDQEIAIPANEPLPFPKWHIVHPVVDLSLHGNISKSDPEVLCKVISLEFINTWYNYLHVYTDGSKDDEHCTAAFYIPEYKYKCGERLEDYCNNFDAELVAILKALTWVYDKQIMKSVIFSDSLSALQVIKALKISDSNIVKELFFMLYQIQNSGIEVAFAWVPSHVGIPGNEMVDKIAKESYDKPVTIFVNKSKRVIERNIDKSVMDIWQDRWDLSNKGRFYYSVNPVVREKPSFSVQDRLKETQLTRLRFGTCWLNNTRALFEKEGSDLCDTCLVRENVEHFLLECVKHFSLSLELVNLILEKNESCDVFSVLKDPDCLNIIWQYLSTNSILV